MFRKIISIILSFCFLFTQTGFAQAAAVELNLSGYFAKMASNFTPIDSFRPLHLRYFSYDTLNNNFKVLLDKGDFEKGLSSPQMQGLSPSKLPQGALKGTVPELKGTIIETKLKEETKQLLKYFLIGVTLPNDTFWVNLRPDSPSQIIDSVLEETDIGKIMLEADLQLKKDTANYTSPQTPEGREYWDKLYKKAEELYGYQTVEIPTLTRPWIVPNEIIVRETTTSAYIYKATLKVMLEQDYLKDSANYSFKDERSKALNEYSSQLIRELIVPKLTKEVNTSKKYASLRQVYYSLILSRWFKERFQGLSPQGKAPKPIGWFGAPPSVGTVPDFITLINSQNLTNLTSKTIWDKSTYFNAYKKSFAQGEYNIKEPVYTPTGQVIRNYFSGGVELSSSAITPMGYRVTKPLDNFLELLRGKGNTVFSIDPNGNLGEIGSSPINKDAAYHMAFGMQIEISGILKNNLPDHLPQKEAVKKMRQHLQACHDKLEKKLESGITFEELKSILQETAGQLEQVPVGDSKSVQDAILIAKASFQSLVNRLALRGASEQEQGAAPPLTITVGQIFTWENMTEYKIEILKVSSNDYVDVMMLAPKDDDGEAFNKFCCLPYKNLVSLLNNLNMAADKKTFRDAAKEYALDIFASSPEPVASSAVSKKTLSSYSDDYYKGKVVEMRVDFNVPIKDGVVQDDSRIRAVFDTLEYLTKRGAKVLLTSHLGRPQKEFKKIAAKLYDEGYSNSEAERIALQKLHEQFTLAPVAKRLQELAAERRIRVLDFNANLFTARDAKSFILRQMKNGEAILLENLRLPAAEEAYAKAPDANKDFADALFEGVDIFVNDAFAVSHRAHASVVGAPKGIPRLSGILMQREIASTDRDFKTAVMGGIKVLDKIKVIKALLGRVDRLLIGGAMANAFLKAGGMDVGNSVGADEEDVKIAKSLLNDAALIDPKTGQSKLVLPVDAIIADDFSDKANYRVITIGKDAVPDGWMIVDIGPKTIVLYDGYIQDEENAIFWNGPMGAFDKLGFAGIGTASMAKSVSQAKAETVAGGGDSLSAIKRYLTPMQAELINHISTAGGAYLEYIEKGSLPGIEALSDASSLGEQASSAVAVAKIAPQDALIQLDYIMRMLNVTDYPRVMKMLETSTDVTAFVENGARISGKIIPEFLATLDRIPYFAPIAAYYRIKTAESFDQREFSEKIVAVNVNSNSYFLGDIPLDLRGHPLSDYLSLMRENAAEVPFAFRDGMERFVGRFLGKRPAERDNPDLSDIVEKIKGFLASIDLGEIKYVFTSGIGANEMYSHQLAAALNVYLKAVGSNVKWIVVNNPEHLSVIPEDATAENSLVFEMSRSGGTKETTDFLEATTMEGAKSRFTNRIVVANAGKLKELGLRFQETNKEARVLIIDNTPGYIGGRQMNRKTLMTYAPLFIALAVGLKDIKKAEASLKSYVAALFYANEYLSYQKGSKSAAVRLAEFLFRHRESGRNKFSVIYDNSLKATAKELIQLINEGANKNVIDGYANDNILDSYSLQDDWNAYVNAFQQAPESQLPIFLLNSNDPQHKKLIEYIDRLNKKGIPAITLSVDLKQEFTGFLAEEFESNLETLARTTALLQDMAVYFTYITRQDANSNPEVKLVREITAVMPEIILEKKNEGRDFKITISEVLDKISQKQKADTAKAKKAIDDKAIIPSGHDRKFDKLQSAISELAANLGLTPEVITGLFVGSISKEVLKIDMGEAGGRPTAEIDEAFSRSRIMPYLGKLTQPRKLRLVRLQQFLEDSNKGRISVALPQVNMLHSKGTLAEQLAEYFLAMYDYSQGKTKYLALTFMESDENNPAIKELRDYIVEKFGDLDITCLLQPMPRFAHTGIEGPMSHPEKIINITIAYTDTYGKGSGGLGIQPVGGLTLDETLYMYIMSNSIRMPLGGTPSVFFELKNRDNLEEIKDTIKKALDIFRSRIDKERAASSAVVTPAPILIGKVRDLGRIEGGIKGGVGLADVHGRVFKPVNQFFNAEGMPTAELNAFIESLSDKSIQDLIHAGIMYYDIRSKFWKDNPAFTAAFALAFAKKLQEKTGKKDGIILHIAVDAYHKHFETAQVFADTILRTGICDNGGGIYYWGVLNGGDVRNYAQLFEAVNGEGGHWVLFTMSHRKEDFLGAKLGINAQVFCGPEVRHTEGVTSGTLYDTIIGLKKSDFINLKHKTPTGTIINIDPKSILKNNIQVAADMIRATSAKGNIPNEELLKGLKIYVDMGGNPISQNLVEMLKGLGLNKVKELGDVKDVTDLGDLADLLDFDLVVGNANLDPSFNTSHIIDPNEHRSEPIQRLKMIAQATGRIVLALDPDGDRAGMVAVGPDGNAVSFRGSQLLLTNIENLAVNYPVAPTIICDMRASLSAKDLEEALIKARHPVKVVPFEAGYPFFMKGMANLPADLAVEDTLHAFINPMTNPNWGAPREYRRPDGKGYQGGDNGALYLIYLLGCIKHQWSGREPAAQLEWLRQTYGLKPTIADERKPALAIEDDAYKYMIAERMVQLARKWFSGKQDFWINFNDPNVKVLSGVHITNTKTHAMVLVRFSNSGPGFTITGEGYLKEVAGLTEEEKRTELDEMLGVGYVLITTAVKQLKEEDHQFTFNLKDAADLEGKFDVEKYLALSLAPQASSAAVEIGTNISDMVGNIGDNLDVYAKWFRALQYQYTDAETKRKDNDALEKMLGEFNYLKDEFRGKITDKEKLKFLRNFLVREVIARLCSDEERKLLEEKEGDILNYFIPFSAVMRGLPESAELLIAAKEFLGEVEELSGLDQKQLKPRADLLTTRSSSAVISDRKNDLDLWEESFLRKYYTVAKEKLKLMSGTGEYILKRENVTKFFIIFSNLCKRYGLSEEEIKIARNFLEVVKPQDNGLEDLFTIRLKSIEQVIEDGLGGKLEKLSRLLHAVKKRKTAEVRLATEASSALEVGDKFDWSDVSQLEDYTIKIINKLSGNLVTAEMTIPVRISLNMKRIDRYNVDLSEHILLAVIGNLNLLKARIQDLHITGPEEDKLLNEFREEYLKCVRTYLRSTGVLPVGVNSSSGLRSGGERNRTTSSAVEAKAPGGIDFKNQAMASATTYETFGSFAGLDYSLPTLSASAIAGFNVDKEEIEISRLVDNQILPSGQRIKEFMAASAAKGEFGQRRETVIAWLAKMGMLEETHCCTQEASKEYKEAIVIAESYAAI